MPAPQTDAGSLLWRLKRRRDDARAHRLWRSEPTKSVIFWAPPPAFTNWLRPRGRTALSCFLRPSSTG